MRLAGEAPEETRTKDKGNSMIGKLILAAGVALALSVSNIQAQYAPGPKGKGPGGPGINKECPQSNCPLAGQGECGQGKGPGQCGLGQGKGQGGPGMGMGLSQGKGPANGMGKGKCLRDGSGPNCPRPSAN